MDQCQCCLLFKANPQKMHLEAISVTHLLELLHIGYMSLEPGKGKEENVLVVMDHYTRYV